MSSKKEEERNEKIIRGLMKLPPNRRCINCNSLGPQYVCTNFWTFVCIACSGIHREFTHRVKSVSMAKFTAQEVDALQRAGNQRARELFLKEWDTQRMRLPDSSNPDKIREFIKTVYVDKKYAGGRSFDKPPRDMQSLKGHEEDHRRASSYHSFSQSPPYEHQYEERRYGKQTGILTRKPGSDRGHYEGKISSFVYSPGRLAEQMYEDRFANESSGSRISDYSVSSVGDPFRFDGQSPNFHDTGYSSPPTQQVRDILVADAQPQTSSTFSDVNTKRDLERITHSHRTASSGSFRSFDSNSVSLKSANSGSLMEMLESETKQAETSTLPSSMQILPMHAANEDLFGLPFVQPPISSSASPINLFADVSHPPTLPTAVEQKPSADPFSDLNEGWATFDLPHHVAPSLEANKEPPSVAPPVEATLKGSNDAFSSVHSGSEWFSVQNSAHSSLMADQWHVGFNEIKTSADSMSPQTWNAFGDSMGNVPQMLPGTLSQNSQSQVLLPMHPPSGDFFAGLRAPEATIKDGFQSPLDDKISTGSIPLTGMAVSSFPSSVLTQGGTIQERKSANPFDLPYDSDADGHNVFLDMSSLQDALPNSALPTTFLGGLPQPWFPQNPVTSFIPSVPQGGLPYMVGQVPSSQLSNIPQQGPVSSLGGNPFA